MALNYTRLQRGENVCFKRLRQRIFCRILHCCASLPPSPLPPLTPCERFHNTLMVPHARTLIRPISAASVRASYFSACARIWVFVPLYSRDRSNNIDDTAHTGRRRRGTGLHKSRVRNRSETTSPRDGFCGTSLSLIAHLSIRLPSWAMLETTGMEAEHTRPSCA